MKHIKNTQQSMSLLRSTMPLLLAFTLLSLHTTAQQSKAVVLKTDRLQRYVTYFNTMEEEDVKNYIPNDQAYSWLAANIPLFECPDSILQQTYYYRWWTFRKHLKETPDGFIFTEFILPVKHAGKHNAISCAAGHHIYEGRWLHEQKYLDQYIAFWLYVADKGETKPRFHQFSSWIDDAIYNRFLINRDTTFLKNHLVALDADYNLWEKERQLASGMYWQNDVKDGMEESMSGSRRDKNERPTINSYMYGNAAALASMATLLNNDSLKLKYQQKATQLRTLTESSLWNSKVSFFETKRPDGTFADVREAIGFIPWYFNLPADDAKHAQAWDQLIDTTGFNAPWGQTTAERRNPTFRTRGSGSGCEWDGALWPFATTQTMKGLSNLLTNYRNHGKMTSDIFYNQLYKYAWSQQKNGKPYLGEYQDECTGYWLKGDNPRSSYYNHSGFTDLIISDLVGIKPGLENTLRLYPLIPKNKWDWFCLDNVLYHNRIITILWDKTGKKYNKGKGMIVYADGKEIYRGKQLKPVTIPLP